VYSEIVAVCSEINTKYMNKRCGQNVVLLYVKLVVHIVALEFKGLNLCYKTSQLMLYRKIITVCSEIHTKRINTLCGQNVELLSVKLAVHIVTTGLQRVASAQLYGRVVLHNTSAISVYLQTASKLMIWQ
jgi:hypothetical protein